MTYKETVEWLRSYKALHDQLIYLNNRIIGLQAINYEPSTNGMPKSKNALIDEWDEVKAQMITIENAIDGIDDKYARMVLGYRYLQFKTLEEIAEIMGYSTRWIAELIKKGIKSSC